MKPDPFDPYEVTWPFGPESPWCIVGFWVAVGFAVGALVTLGVVWLA